MYTADQWVEPIVDPRGWWTLIALRATVAAPHAESQVEERIFPRSSLSKI